MRKVRANGGHVIHLLPDNTMTALCGHTPTNNSRGYQRRSMMTNRAKWWLLNDQSVAVTCPKCKAREPMPLAIDTNGAGC